MSQPCPNCGTLNLDSYRFCSNCGALLRPGEAPPAPQAATSLVGDTGAIPPAAAGAPTMSFTPPPPPPPAEAESARTIAMSQQPPVAGEPAYVVKTAPDAESMASQAPTTSMAGFIPPAPIGSSSQQPPAPPAYGGYQGGYPSSPGTSAGREGAVYAPYASGPVAALEKPKESRSWLMPIIVVAALVLVGLAAIGIYATQNKGANGGQNTISQSNNSGGDNTTPGSQATPGGDKSVGSNLPTPTALPANASDEDKVREVIRRSNDMQIKAWEDLNTDILSDYYTDQALADNVDMVKQLRDRNMTAKPRYQKLDILDVSVSGNTATAHTIEVWTVIFTNKTDMRPNVTGPDTLKETYHLVKKGDKWYVSKLEIATPVPATATPSGT